MKIKKNFLLIFIFTFFLGCRENNMKIKIYYNEPGEWPDVGRSVDFVKNGQCKYIQLYNLEELEINNFSFLNQNEDGMQSNVEEKIAENITSLSFLCAETLFEILDKNNQVIFSYLYFENEDYYLNTKNFQVYHMTEEIKNLSERVICRLKTDDVK